MAGWKGCECLKVKKCKTWEGYFNLSTWIYFIKINWLSFFINFRVIEDLYSINFKTRKINQ